MASSQSLIVASDDGFPLAVTRFDARAGGTRAAVVIGCATGARAHFYHDFAAWLATQGVGAVTFDYRYVGLSFPPPYNPQTFTYEERRAAVIACPPDVEMINTWGQKDMKAVIQFASMTWSDVPLTVVGHSLGAHLMSLIPEVWPRISRLLNVCGGNIYHHYLSAKVNQVTRSVMETVETDRLLRVSAIGLGFDLPYGPGKEWIRGYLHPHSSLRDPVNADISQKMNIPYLCIGFTDDLVFDKNSIYQHVSLFPHPSKSQPIHSLWIDPKKNPNWPPIGHAGAFISSAPKANASKAETIWAVLLRWILDGMVDESVGEYRRWTSADSRDLQKERGEFERGVKFSSRL